MATIPGIVKKDKNQNIQVFVRLRPLNARERAIRSHGVVDVVNGREVHVKLSHQSSHNKKFTFDRAFGPNAPQVEVYKEVVSPLIAEVLAGYNCTVFAYGQTGTGKTHTMVGESSGEGTTWQNDPLAGIIPRALSQLFDELRISATEFNVRVSYLELYNEELCDLLSSSLDTSKLRIYEDVNRKGSTIVNGLEEITVYNKNEVYEIMARGQERKKVASTLMNSQSSRSHTVFTIVVHIKENNQKGEELVKIGKLNLVDLAGSENISKAGSDNPAKKERARECVNINQSLLTLGRVITALVEKHPHIPYRESKLTRILQESLGGRTKTSIIATISPGHKDLEETLSTLEYANRAKNIQNKPEVNQKLTKQVILKEYAEEVDKLKRELSAAREKNGVYLPTEDYTEMMLKDEEHRREISELLLKKRAMEEERERMESIFTALEQQHNNTQSALLATSSKLDYTVTKLEETTQEKEEARHLVERHAETESQLTSQAQEILSAADLATSDVQLLHDTVDRRRSIETSNVSAVSTYREASTSQRQAMLATIEQCCQHYGGARGTLQTSIDDSARDTSMTQEMTIQDMKLIAAKLAMFVNEIKSLTTETSDKLSRSESECAAQLSGACGSRRARLEGLVREVQRAVGACVQRAENTDTVGTVNTATQQWLAGATTRVSCLQRTHSSFAARAREIANTRDAHTRRRHAQRVQALKEEEELIHTCIQQLERDKKEIEERMTQHLASIQADREDTQRKLQQIMDHMLTSAARHETELQQQKQLYEESTNKIVELQKREIENLRRQREEAERGLEEEYTEAKDERDNVDEFDKDFGEGSHAIAAEMEAFSGSVTHIVEHAHKQILTQLRDRDQHIQQTAATALSEDAEASRKQLEQCCDVIRSALRAAGDALTTVANNTEETTSSSLETMNSVTERASRLASSALRTQSAQTEALNEATQALHTASDQLRQEITQQADVEGRYLMREYRVYSPSGHTPARKEYRYPRRLAATSPHERILARFRQRDQRDQRRSPDSDCIVVESDEGRNGSDSDEVSESSVSGVSEDSGVAQQ